MAIFRIHGPFLFGSTQKLDVIEENLNKLPRVVLIRLRNMTAIDSTGLHALETVAAKLQSTGRDVILCGMRSQPKSLISRPGTLPHIPRENICYSLRDALTRARTLLQQARPAPVRG